MSDEIVKKNAELITNISLISSKFTSENALKLIALGMLVNLTKSLGQAIKQRP